MALWTWIVIPILVLLFVVYIFVKHRFSYWKIRGIPHDEPLFPGGNIVKNCHFIENLRKNYHKFKKTGPFGGFFINLRPAVVLYDLDLIKNVLVKDFNNFTERGLFHNDRDDPPTWNLFRLDGAEWKPFRKQLSPSFSGIRLQEMFQTIVVIGQNLVKTFADNIEFSNSVLDVNELVGRYAADVNGNCVFGVDCNSLSDGNANFFRTVKALPGLKIHSKIVYGFIASFPKLAQNLRMRKTHDDWNDFFLPIVREAIEYREKNFDQRNNFLNLMVEMKKTDDSLSLEKIAAQTSAFFYAGFDNSTATIGLTLYELAFNQDVQDKLRAEIVSCMEKYRQQLTVECMKEMRYLKKVIEETLRKYPIVPFLRRLAKNDYKTSQAEYVIPRGTIVLIPIEAIQNDPDVYEEPEKFDPERFSPEEAQQRETTTWLPFGEGPRHCIGSRFAKMQIFVAVILLLKNYKFSPCDQTESVVQWDREKKILEVKNGIYLRVEHI